MFCISTTNIPSSTSTKTIIDDSACTFDNLAKLSQVVCVVEMVSTHEAKSRLSEIIRKVEQGGDVVVARNGVPVVRIIPWVGDTVKKPGAWSGQINYGDEDIVGSDPDVLAAFQDSAGSV